MPVSLQEIISATRQKLADARQHASTRDLESLNAGSMHSVVYVCSMRFSDRSLEIASSAKSSETLLNCDSDTTH
jgi:hypothetical protein